MFERPSSVFVARFVGDPQANIIDVKVVRVMVPLPFQQQSQPYTIIGEGFQVIDTRYHRARHLGESKNPPTGGASSRWGDSGLD